MTSTSIDFRCQSILIGGLNRLISMISIDFRYRFLSINYVWTIRPHLHGSRQIFELTNFTGATGLHRTFATDCSTFCRSKTYTVPREPCKRKTDPCKSLSVQKFVHTGGCKRPGPNCYVSLQKPAIAIPLNFFTFVHPCHLFIFC